MCTLLRHSHCTQCQRDNLKSEACYEGSMHQTSSQHSAQNVGRLRPGAPAGARRFAVRTSIGLATLALARYVPFLAYVMAFIGSLLTVSVSIIFPAACHLSIFQARHGYPTLPYPTLPLPYPTYPYPTLPNVQPKELVLHNHAGTLSPSLQRLQCAIP